MVLHGSNSDTPLSILNPCSTVLYYESEPERRNGGAWVLTLQQHTGVGVAHTTLATLILVAVETRQTRLGGSWKGDSEG
jgi:hypothetical protein